VNCKRKSKRRFFLLMRSRTPPISSEFRGVEHSNPPPLGTPLTTTPNEDKPIPFTSFPVHPPTNTPHRRYIRVLRYINHKQNTHTYTNTQLHSTTRDLIISDVTCAARSVRSVLTSQPMYV